MPSEKKKYLSGNLDQMALSLSGGGVRAAGFHLGTMSMLRRLGLLHNVQILSTVSGGSMPGIGYSLAQQLGRSFQDFFDDFYDFLPRLNILEQLLSGLSDRHPPSFSGKRHMITAMANIYHDFYFNKYFGSYVKAGGLTFDVLMKQPGQGHLKEMIFNATEFKSGTAFRFQVSQFRCLIGNGNIALCRKHAGQIRIADIMAASSCIPVGMEPMFFPDDFHWPDDIKRGRWKKQPLRKTNQEIRDALIRNTDTNEPTIALMDGGVYDNQGITSTLLALNRRQGGAHEADTHECGVSMSKMGRSDPPGPEDWAKWMSGRVKEGSSYKTVGVKPEDLDLLIVSDTPVRKASFFPRVLFSQQGIPVFGDAEKQKGHKANSFWKGIAGWLGRKLTIGRLSLAAWVLLVALLISATFSWFELHWTSDIFPDDSDKIFKIIFLYFHVLLPLLLLVLNVLVLYFLRRFKRRLIEKLEGLIKKWDRKPAKYINKLRIVDLMEMGSVRAGSTAALTSAIFMDRIRGLGYSTAFSREDLRDKILVNEIFALQQDRESKDKFHSMLREEGAWPPCDELNRIVGVAATMPTKLWIDQEEGDPLSDFDYLVICGQATICYNLLKHLWEELREDDGSWIDPKMSQVFDLALVEWKKLMHDPLCMLKDRKRKSRLPWLKEHAEELEALKV